MQADIYAKQGKTSEAAALLERLALTSLQEALIAVTKLIPLLVSEGKFAQGEQLAKASQAEYEAFGLWQYSAYLAPMQLAVAKRDVKESIRLISAMLNAVMEPGNLLGSPLYCHQPHKEEPAEMTKQFLPPLLADLETSPDYAFLRDKLEFVRLIADCRAKACLD